MGQWEDLCSPKALVCKREINCDQGGAVVFMVCLSDGFLIDCGSGAYAEKRAIELATVINANDPERFNFGKRRSTS